MRECYGGNEREKGLEIWTKEQNDKNGVADYGAKMRFVNPK